MALHTSTRPNRHFPSRRQLERDVELWRTRALQGKEALRTLTALVLVQGGAARIPRDDYDGLPDPGPRLNVLREKNTGDIVLRVASPARRAVEEVTFEELKKRLQDAPAHTPDQEPVGICGDAAVRPADSATGDGPPENGMGEGAHD